MTRSIVNPRMNATKNETARIVANARNGDGPAYAAPRARRSNAWLPQAAISPIDNSAGPTRETRFRAPPNAPDRTMARPRIEKSQPTTNSAGEARPSIVNVEAPGR